MNIHIHMRFSGALLAPQIQYILLLIIIILIIN